MSCGTNQTKISGAPFTTRYEDLPEALPLFPLSGVLLLPHGRLPLNIFEPRYVAMVEEALAHGRLIGMVQPTGQVAADGTPQIFNMGCAGRIHSFNETEDGRFLISLYGVCRFRIHEEIGMKNGFRRARVAWDAFKDDLAAARPALVDREKLVTHMRAYFRLQGVCGDWDMIDRTDDNRLITSLAMICPFQPGEKQALLEAQTLEECCNLLITMMDMALLEDDAGADGCVRH